MAVKRLPTLKNAAEEQGLAYEHPLYKTLLSAPGLDVAVASLDALLTWGAKNSLWVFPMGTSCCAIELMAAAAARVDLDRMGTIVRATPRQADVMVVAGTITVKMAPRVLTLWEQMPEPKWCIAMGSCAISGDFYRDLYSVVPGVDTFLPVDVYIPGCPPNPEALMDGLLRLQEKIALRRAGALPPRETKPLLVTNPSVARLADPARDASLSAQQEAAAAHATEHDADDELHADPAVRPAPPGDAPLGDPAELEAIFEEHGVTDFPKGAAPMVGLAWHVALAHRLRAAGFTQLVYVVATHFPEKTGKTPDPEHVEVAYALRSIGRGSRIAAWRVRARIDEAVPSLVGVFAGADWQEREQFDLVGVRFDGHPDLRRILLPGDWQGHPLRKDYASNTGCPPWR